MEYHYGRLLDHVHLVVTDLAASKRFYRAVLQVLGRGFTAEGPDYFQADELLVSAGAADSHSQVHLAFQAGDPRLLPYFYQAGLAAGGSAAIETAQPLQHAAVLCDPDGNHVAAVCHDRQQPTVSAGTLAARRPDSTAPFTVCE